MACVSAYSRSSRIAISAFPTATNDATRRKDRRSWRFASIGVDEARAVTGLEPEHLLRFDGSQAWERVHPDGRREPMLTVPAEFVPKTFPRA